MVRAEEMQMLAYGIAHEIKNPLGGILGAAQWILRGEGPDEDRAKGVRLILREARRINDLVEKMLEMGKTPSSFRPSPPPCCARRSSPSLRVPCPGKGDPVRSPRGPEPSRSPDTRTPSTGPSSTY